MRLVISGGTGLIGSMLTARLSKEGHSAVVLTRSEGPMRVPSPNVETEHWDGIQQGPWANRLEKADAVINLAGESIGSGRWTAARKRRLIDSRIQPTRTLVEAMRRATHKPAVLINASAVGYYGSVEEGEVTESHPAGGDFLATLCTRWEEEAAIAGDIGIRVVILRFGVVLDRNAMAFRRLTLPFRLFAGGWLGNGNQWFPWVHGDDVAGSIIFAAENRTLSGPVNVAAPESVTMKEFSRTLGSVMRRPCWAPVPGFVLRALLGEMSGMVLTGQRVIPRKETSAGYVYRYPALKRALETILLYPPA